MTAPVARRRVRLACLLFFSIASTASAGDDCPNLLLVTLDTWRADALGRTSSAYQTPHLDALAERGVHLTRVLTVAPITLPAHASLLTGLYPNRHGVRDNGFSRLGLQHETLAERLGDAGYQTSAVTAAFVLHHRFGLDQGYRDYADVPPAPRASLSTHYPEIPAEEVTRRAGQALETMPPDRPWHLWVHYFDAHHPYLAHDGLGDGYAAEIAWVDVQLGRLLEEVRRRPDGRRTLILVVADHGESLGEAGEPTHGYLLNNTTVQVFALLAGPGVPVARIDDWVSMVDLAPTLADILDLPPAPSDGSSLLPWDQPPPERTLFAETFMPYTSFRYAPSVAAVRPPHHLVVSGDKVEVSDSDSPPDAPSPRQVTVPENLVPVRTKGLLKAEEFLRSEVDRYLGASDSGTPTGAGAEDLRALSSLGYLGAPSDPGAESESLPAASDRLDFIHEVLNVEQQLGRRAVPSVFNALRSLANREPDNPRVRLLLAQLLMGQGNLQDALETLTPLRDSGPAFEALYQEALGQHALAKGDLPAARDAFSAAVALDEGNAAVHANLGYLALARRDLTSAVSHYRRARELNPEDAIVNFNLALSVLKLGGRDEAERLFTEVLDRETAATEWVAGAAASLRSEGLSEPAGFLEALLDGR